MRERRSTPSIPRVTQEFEVAMGLVKDAQGFMELAVAMTRSAALQELLAQAATLQTVDKPQAVRLVCMWFLRQLAT